MSFNRLKSQILCESMTGCADLIKWSSYKGKLGKLSLDENDVDIFRAALASDAKDLYLKGVQSLAEAISSSRKRLFSWATVKAYYSVFYLLRSSLAIRDFAVIRNQSLYLLQIIKGASPEQKTEQRYRNDHIGIINIYRDLFETSDRLQSNAIEGTNSYEWLMDRRHQINYWEKEFHDPFAPDFFSTILSYITAGKFEELLATYISDECNDPTILDTKIVKFRG